MIMDSKQKVNSKEQYSDEHIRLYASRILDSLCDEGNPEAIENFLDRLRTLEEKWTADDYSDGLCTYSLLERQINKFDGKESFENKLFLLDYRTRFFSSNYVQKLKLSQLDIELDLKSISPVYYMIGEQVVFGRYVRDGHEWSMSSPLFWEVLDNKSGIVLLSCVDGIEPMPYGDSKQAVTWQNSKVRYWLNDDFLNRAFDAREKSKLIKDVEGDYVSLLAASEAMQYYPDDNARSKKATKYAISRGAIVDNSLRCWWWLKDKGQTEGCAAIVYNNGRVMELGNIVDYQNRCVSPVVRIKL